MQHYIGLMSGTSVDGIDAAVVALGGPGEFRLKASHQHPIPDRLRADIQALMRAGDNEIERCGALDMQLGELFAQAANQVLAAAGLKPPDIQAIGSHGQTVRHRPRANSPFTIQIGNPSVIAERTGITTVADFRPRDLAAGGEGAPLVPGFHRWLFQRPGRHRAVVNIGGIANVTDLPADPAAAVIGFDTGPGNTLLDAWIARHQGRSHDANGAWAASGALIPALLRQLLSDPYFARPAPKSTGREHFHLAWLEAGLALASPEARPEDVQTTLTALTAESIAGALKRDARGLEDVFVCGGGRHNATLMHALAQALPGITVTGTEALGLEADWVEAAAFAWLARETLAGRPGNVPTVTGARRAVVLGGIFPA